jgi:hypothetical protein
MSTNAWNKKAIAGIAIFTVAGAMSPIAASAVDMGPSSITYTVDLGDGSGGGGNVCPTQTTFTVDPGASQVTSLGTTLPLSSDANQQNIWYDLDNDGNNETRDDFNEWERNKKHSYAFTPIEVTFDADGCEASTLTADIYPTRTPVLRADSLGDPFTVAEIRSDESANVQTGFGTANNVGMANLFVNSGTPWGSNLNYNYPYWNQPIWTSAQQLNTDTDAGDWYPMAMGSDGQFKAQPRIDIFGDQPTGLYKVTYNLWLETYDPGLSGNNFCWMFC